MKLKSCPFCGSEDVYYFSGWKGGTRAKHKKYELGKEPEGRSPSISCEECGIGLTAGWFGYGISDANAKKYTCNAWNKRA